MVVVVVKFVGFHGSGIDLGGEFLFEFNFYFHDSPHKLFELRSERKKKVDGSDSVA